MRTPHDFMIKRSRSFSFFSLRKSVREKIKQGMLMLLAWTTWGFALAQYLLAQ